MKLKLGIPGFIRKDFLRKLVAFFFAVLVWKAVDVQLHEFETISSVPVRINYEAGKIVVDNRLVTADVTVRGSRRRLQKLQVTDLSINADVPVVEEGVRNYELRLSPSDVRTPPGVRVQSISPSRIQIPVDRIVSRDVPVRVNDQGELSPGYRVQERKVVPSNVTVIGPSKIVNDISRLSTEAILLRDNLTHDFNQDNVALEIPANVQVSPRTVHVAYSIARHTAQKNVNDIPIRVLFDRDSQIRLKKELPKVSITVRGTKTELEKLQPHMVRAFVDLSTITGSGNYQRPVNTWVENPAITVEYVHPETVQVELIAAKPSPDKPVEENQQPEVPDTPATTE
jgi:YbbR domain-containing protein